MLFAEKLARFETAAGRFVHCVAAVLLVLCAGNLAAEEKAFEPIDPKVLFEELEGLVEIQTYRGGKLDEAQVAANLDTVADYFARQVAEFNKGQEKDKIAWSQWQAKNLDYQPGEALPEYHKVFIARLGQGEHKVVLSSHLDTVPPGEATRWDGGDPFKLRRAYRQYQPHKSGQELFYAGRGSIDDKGPAIVAFDVLRQIAREYDGRLGDVTIELLLDTSEETDMSFPHYLKTLTDKEQPKFGVIFDAMWCDRAEKGLERPVFTIPRRSGRPAGDLWIESLNSSLGAANQIPDSATAVLKGEGLHDFAHEVVELYHSWEPADDASYRKAEFKPLYSEESLELTTLVAGAQHGSAPEENRALGANPLVSLANFLAYLVSEERLAPNEISRMCQLIEWLWGTWVFGEPHAELFAYDDVFTEGNGTTYAVTWLRTQEEVVKLQVDIRYALGHHSVPWDHQTEGWVGDEHSKSRFADIFSRLVDSFNGTYHHKVKVETRTLAPPDIRLPAGPSLSKVDEAYKKAMGASCPMRALGGGTDAKGHTELAAAGALFTESLGPPINFHGLNEGAPVDDLLDSERILYQLFKNEIEAAAGSDP